MITKCDACGKEIRDEYFIGGFEAGHRNLKLSRGLHPMTPSRLALALLLLAALAVIWHGGGEPMLGGLILLRPERWRL